jgi:hypothetical protein
MKYLGRCHCGDVQFQLTSEPITSGCACNCSICIRKGGISSRSYYSPDTVELLSGHESMVSYMFGDRDVDHRFCKTCGVSVFGIIVGLPPDYTGSARLGDYRINLGCIDELAHETLEVSMIDGRSY